jgi:hypothetical protein
VYQDTFFISINFNEAGPYTIEQLGKLARDKAFTWGHYVHKVGTNHWSHAREVNDIKGVLDKYYELSPGDEGPAGGVVFFHYNGNERRIMEAAPAKVGPVKASDAEKSCTDYKYSGLEDWHLPDEDELRSYSVTHFSDHNKNGFEKSVLLWALSNNAGKFCAVATKERCEIYNPWDHQNDKDNDYRVGGIVNIDESKPLYVLPVRVIKTLQ